MHAGTQCEHTPGDAHTHQNTYIEGFMLNNADLLVGTEERELCSQHVRDIYRSVLGAVTWAGFPKALVRGS